MSQISTIKQMYSLAKYYRMLAKDFAKGDYWNERHSHMYWTHFNSSFFEKIVLLTFETKLPGLKIPQDLIEEGTRLERMCRELKLDGRTVPTNDYLDKYRKVIVDYLLLSEKFHKKLMNILIAYYKSNR